MKKQNLLLALLTLATVVGCSSADSGDVGIVEMPSKNPGGSASGSPLPPEARANIPSAQKK